MNKPILMKISKSGRRIKGMKLSTSGVKKSNVKVTQGRNQIWGLAEASFLDPLTP